MIDLKNYIATVPDFPKPGVLFYDISPLMSNAGAWRETIMRLKRAIEPHQPQQLAAIESRGFLLAAPLALELNCGFFMVRKKGKLPGDRIAHHYDLEYGSATLEIQTNAVKPGERVVILDDVLATGGTMAATITLLQQIHADVRAAACLMELSFLGARSRIKLPLTSILTYSA